MTLSEEYGLNKRIVLKELDKQRLAIVKKIKSRIISKDAVKIVEIANVIRAKTPNKELVLICTSNICSKSKVLLKQNNIDVIIHD